MLKHVQGKIVVKVNHEHKRRHRMDNGEVLILERGWNNLNRREVSEVNAIVISGEGLKEGVEILLSHNAVHETFRITNHGHLSGQKIADRIEYYSIPQDNAFFWLDGETWRPVKGYATALRVFKPYFGILLGIEPTLIKNVLYITSGKLSGKIVHTLRACDYELIFQGLDGRENRIIRCRHYEDEDNEREEIVAIRDDLTKELKTGKLLVGLSAFHAKPLKELVNA